MKKYMIIISVIVVLCSLLAWAADEITVTALLKVENGKFTLLRNVSNFRVDQTGTAMDYGIQSMTNSVTNVLNIANVSDPHYLFLRNLSTSKTIRVTLTVELKPEDVAVLPVLSTNMSAYTTAGGADLEYWINQE